MNTRILTTAVALALGLSAPAFANNAQVADTGADATLANDKSAAVVDSGITNDIGITNDVSKSSTKDVTITAPQDNSTNSSNNLDVTKSDTKEVTVGKTDSHNTDVSVTKSDTKNVTITAPEDHSILNSYNDSSSHRTAVAKSELSASVSSNTVQMGSGEFSFDASNNISGTAFTGNGINTSSQNTGHNSLIQTTYTIQSNVNTGP